MAGEGEQFDATIVVGSGAWRAVADLRRELDENGSASVCVDEHDPHDVVIGWPTGVLRLVVP